MYWLENWPLEIQNLFLSNEIKLILQKLNELKSQGKIIYPSENNLFKAFELTTFNNLKVVILGQDPYHQPHQAHGLAFSVPEGITAPPSLKNIFKELKNDLGINKTTTDLSSWAVQGVLLMNSFLSVEEAKPLSHSKIGWNRITDSIIQEISFQKKNIVFVLWGNFAHSKKELIDTKKHLILLAPHPSPLSASKGFFGSHHFSKINEYLLKNNFHEIIW